MSEQFLGPLTEQQQWRQTPGNIETPLDKGVRVEIPTDEAIISAQGYRVLAVISPGLKRGNQPNSGFYQDIALIDLRDAPHDPTGFKVFRDERYNPDVDYMLVGRSIQGKARGLGFKGLRKGQSFTYGRPEHSNMADARNRFWHGDNRISRNHFKVDVDAEGKVFVTGTSENGTTVSAPRKLAPPPEEAKTVIQRREMSPERAKKPGRVALLGRKLTRR